MQCDPRRLWGVTRGVRIEALEWAPDRSATDLGLPIVFVPGGTGNALFAEVHGEAGGRGRIGSHPRRVLGVSRRGTGLSDAPGAGYRPTDFAADVRAAIAAAGYERFAVFGHSMGVPIALELALERPAGLAALILGDAPPRYIDFKSDRTFASLLEEPFEFRSWEAARATMRVTEDAEADERRWQLIRRIRLAATEHGRVRLLMDRAALLQTIEESETSRTDFAPRLREIAIPVLLVTAARGWSPLQAADVEIYRASVRDLTVESISTDHSLGQHSDALPLHAALGRFLDEVEARTA